jgi:beta-1,2-mannobiose phosphorylase / 1,2-beta-oligomannan phosphorylase
VTAGSDDNAVQTVAIRRVAETPIVPFGAVPGYGPIFNAGAVHHDGLFHLFARGVRDHYRLNASSGARFLDYVSDLLVFTSADGRTFEFQQVLVAAEPDGVYSYEDPRVQRVNSASGEQFVVSYTNLPPPESNEFWRIGVHRLAYADGRFSLEEGSGRIIGPPGEPDKDAVIFNLRDGRVALIHRIYPDMQLAVFDSLEDLWEAPVGYWEAHMANLAEHTIIRPVKTSLGVGAGAPPIDTDDGLLLLYHERDGHERYVTRAALLDPETGRLRSALAEPIMRAELDWERDGDVNNVIFVQGAIPRPDGSIYMTYGAADRNVGAAYVDAAELLRALRAAA